ncbi:TRAP-type C4-dicarboxylate transporter, periplasmic solute-binding protein [Candidatus Scalindua japonica]|uniref:TRAP-type C4-dicarboxylate transporter, periplasmic solute-binding protein n=1 Tax=Candidatus Scalindua japonica TaxID=1284222 RepID=A0A286TWQ5_9BACT|nr:response regulator transcription factor [Candidatus Scalindua japonica]GAX60327.1 TRAP-type C4-dicarboxylate transporter, periplasmic solute-binding protein [Candidatus Scalindua japonica]
MSKIRVLLADDHTIVRQGLIALLDSHEDIEIVGEAENGRQAFEKTKQMIPDIVVLDITMPNLNGIEATRKIKKLNPEIKVIVLTMHDNEEYVYQLLQAGASGYLLKESAVSDLVSAINAVKKGDIFLSPKISKVVVKDYIKHTERESKAFDSLNMLTSREREVLQLIAEGYTNKEVARLLKLSIKTVDIHRAHIKEKLQIRDTAGLVKYSIRHGLIKF